MATASGALVGRPTRDQYGECEAVRPATRSGNYAL
jgi:hypothetical protein